MTPEECRVKSLELAIVQAKNEGSYGDINRVVQLATMFYNHITGAPEPVPETEPVKAPRKTKADKAIFE